ncbi:MAG: serine/threonine protein kinase [Myxococcales bacterium]|nr:serine/threonine protein kinase [Myxococcales bacterium]
MPATSPYPLGPYLLFKSLKKGGMARVFLAVRRDDPARLLAVKTLLPKLASQGVYREMFASEGEVGRLLRHRHIARTVDHGEAGGTPYIAMEYVFGADLAAVNRRLRRDGRLLPLPVAVTLVRHVVSGLAHAHGLCDDHGRPLDIVNRDVSPGNVMVAFDGAVKLIDFGIAQTTIDVKSQIGTIKGKISYMAPEQVRGLPVDARADLFSVGTVLYELLTGVHVFHDEGDFATMERVRRAEAPPPSTHRAEIDADLDALVARALAREVHDRHPDAQSLLDALDAWLAAHGGPVSDAVVADTLRSLFGRQIDSLRADIDGALAKALGTAPANPAAPEASDGPGVLIPEEALADLGLLQATPPPAAEPPPSARQGVPAAVWWVLGLAALAAAGLLRGLGVL